MNEDRVTHAISTGAWLGMPSEAKRSPALRNLCSEAECLFT
jgi:hypothetical protein